MGYYARMARRVAALALAGVAFGAAAAHGELALETRTIESSSADYEINASYPHSGIKAIDDDIVAWVNAEVASLKANGPPDREWASGAYSLAIDYEVARNDASGLALLFTELIDTGGAHPNHGVYTLNYRMPSARRIQLDQILDGDRGLQRLSALAIADLLPRLTAPEMGADVDGIRTGAGPDWANFSNFLLLPDALRIIFPPYQVAAYVFGTQEVTLPLSRLSTVLRDAPATPAPAAAATALDDNRPRASFDCSKASTPSERTICSDAALARLDYDLAHTYAARLASAPPAAGQALKTSQRAWLRIRDHACRDQSAAAAVSCLTGVYRARHSELLAPP